MNHDQNGRAKRWSASPGLTTATNRTRPMADSNDTRNPSSSEALDRVIAMHAAAYAAIEAHKFDDDEDNGLSDAIVDAEDHALRAVIATPVTTMGDVQRKIAYVLRHRGKNELDEAIEALPLLESIRAVFNAERSASEVPSIQLLADLRTALNGARGSLPKLKQVFDLVRNKIQYFNVVDLPCGNHDEIVSGLVRLEGDTLDAIRNVKARSAADVAEKVRYLRFDFLEEYGDRQHPYSHEKFELWFKQILGDLGKLAA